MDKLFTSN